MAAQRESGHDELSGSGQLNVPDRANTLVRGLLVLQCFSASSPSLGNREISELTGLPKPTVSRLTSTLTGMGFLRRVVGSPRFEVGPAALCLGYPVLARLAFQRITIPILQSLATELDGIAVIAVRDRLRIVTLETVVQRDVFKRNPNTGSTRPFIGTTLGRCWLVSATSAERDRLFREVAHEAPHELDGLRAEYDAGIKQLIALGYFSLRDTLARNTAVVATPLRRRPGDDLLILALGFETQPHTAEQLVQRAGRALMEGAGRIAEQLAQRPVADAG